MPDEPWRPFTAARLQSHRRPLDLPDRKNYPFTLLPVFEEDVLVEEVESPGSKPTLKMTQSRKLGKSARFPFFFVEILLPLATSNMVELRGIYHE